MPRLGEEAPIGDELVVSVVWCVLQKHVDVVRVISQPGEEFHGCIERPTLDVGLPEPGKVREGLVDRDHVPALDDRQGESYPAVSVPAISAV